MSTFIIKDYDFEVEIISYATKFVFILVDFIKNIELF